MNSYYGGDAATGTVTSPPFRIERPYINLLVGGGGHPGTGVELRLDGATVRSVRGPNTRPGGSERLQWKTWEVGPLQGRMARIHIVDQEQDGWGHITVDQIVQSTQRLEAAPLRKGFQISKRYLWVPVKNGAPKHRMQLLVGGRTVREFSLEFAIGEPDWEAFVDVSEFAGRTLTAQLTLRGGASALVSVVARYGVPGAAPRRACEPAGWPTRRPASRDEIVRTAQYAPHEDRVESPGSRRAGPSRPAPRDRGRVLPARPAGRTGSLRKP